MAGPLDDLYASLGLPNYSAPGAQSISPGVSPIQPLAPPQEESTLHMLGQKVLPGIVWAGQALDKTMGARGVRGLLAGNPRELLSVLPFSDSSGLTDPTQAVHGTELLRRAGLIHGEDDDWQNVLAGIGTEIALNPATYLTFGGSALTDAGQAASKLGLLKRMTMLERMQGLGQGAITPEIAAQAARLGINTADIVGQPLGGLAGVGLPFQHPSAVLGTGPMAQNIAGKLGQAADYLKYSMPGRNVSALFDPTVEGTTSGAIQRLMRGSRAAELESGIPAVREPIAGIMQDLARTGQPYDPSLLRAGIEGQGLNVMAPEYNQAASQVRQLLGEDLASGQAAGRPVTAFQSQYGVDYGPRSLAELDRVGGGSQRVLSGTTGNQIGRELYTDVPGGTGTIQGLYRDPTIAGSGATLSGNPARAAIFEQHFGGDIAQMTKLEHLKNIQPQYFGPGSPLEAELSKLHDLWDKADTWAAKLATAEPARVGAQGVGLYNADPLADLLKSRVNNATANANVNVARSVLSNPETYASAAKGGDVVPLRTAIAASGLEPNQAEADIVSSLMRQGMPMPMGGAANMMVPADVFKDLTRLASAGTAADSVSAPLRAVDSLTSLWKRFTLMAPAYFGKKLGSGLFRTLASGGGPGELATGGEIVSALRGAKVYPGLAKLLPDLGASTDAEASAMLGREMFAHQVAGRSQEGLAELAGTSAAPSTLAPQIPGEVAEPGFWDIVKNAYRGRTDATGASVDPLAVRLNPGNIRGVGGVGPVELRNTDQFAPAVAAGQFGKMTDDYTRMAAYIGRRLQGYAPEAASDFTKATQFVGDDLAPFEKQVMRRAIPFYGYVRHKFPYLINDLINNPGGLQAMGIRGAADATELSRDSVPANLGGGMAIPLGGLDDSGKQAYLTRLGLPFDEAASFFGTGPHAAQNTMGKMLGQLNPLLKAPIELASGEHFGQEGLSDVHGPAQGTVLQQLLMNTPAARATSTAATIEKALSGEKSPTGAAINLLTGGKTTEVDPVKEKAIAEQDLIDQLLGNDPNIRKFQNYFVHPADVGTLTPQELLALQLQKSLELRAQAAARAKR